MNSYLAKIYGDTVLLSKKDSEHLVMSRVGTGRDMTVDKRFIRNLNKMCFEAQNQQEINEITEAREALLRAGKELDVDIDSGYETLVQL